MARYIDADQIDYTVTMVGMDENAGYRAVAFESDIDAMPTADVVPKSEYGAVVSAVDNSTKEFLKLHDAYQNARAEVERLTINMNAYGLTAKRLAEENESLEIELENMRRNLGDAREGWNDAECEVDRLRKVLAEYEETSGLKQAKAEVARKIFEEIDEMLDNIMVVKGTKDCFITVFRKTMEKVTAGMEELKKKYTEEET